MLQVSEQRRVSLFVTVFIFMLLFAGCAMKSRPVTEDKRIALKEKTTAVETFKSGPLTVDYEYQRSGNTLTMSGSIDFRQSVDSLDIRVLFLDASGLILDRQLVYSSGFRSFAARDSTRTFRRQLDMVAGAVSFTFDETSRPRTSTR